MPSAMPSRPLRPLLLLAFPHVALSKCWTGDAGRYREQHFVVPNAGRPVMMTPLVGDSYWLQMICAEFSGWQPEWGPCHDDAAPPRRTWLCRDENDPNTGRCEPLQLYLQDERFSRLESRNGQVVNWTLVYDPRGAQPQCYPQVLRVSAVFDSAGQGRVEFQGDTDGLFIAMLLLTILLFLAVGITFVCRLTQFGMKTRAHLRGEEWQGDASAGDDVFKEEEAAASAPPPAPSPPKARGGVYMLAPSEPPASSSGFQKVHDPSPDAHTVHGTHAVQSS